MLEPCKMLNLIVKRVELDLFLKYVAHDELKNILYPFVTRYEFLECHRKNGGLKIS